MKASNKTTSSNREEVDYFFVFYDFKAFFQNKNRTKEEDIQMLK